MLKLDGNSELVFASHNSINIVPSVSIEWNYNSIVKPYAVAPSHSLNLSSADSLKDYQDWAAVTGNQRVSLAKKSGYSTYTNKTTSAIRLSAGDSRTGTHQSPIVSLNPTSTGNYYKLTFYVKADQPVVANNPDTIVSSEIIADSSANGGTTYMYRVVQVDRNGRMAPLDYEFNDVAYVYSDFNANNIKLHWDHTKYRGPVYHI